MGNGAGSRKWEIKYIEGMATWNIRESFASHPPVTNDSDSPVVSTLLSLRGIEGEEAVRNFFSPDYDRDLHNPFLFASMSAVMERIRTALNRDERVGVFGDYDADGVTSSVIMRTALERIGLSVSVYIPHKLTEGHGLHTNALDAFERDGATLIFTVDCGMMNHVEIENANARGMDVIVIDHHHVPETLPKAFAIVNPKLPKSGYPFTELCGAGTSFKVAQAMYREFLPEAVGELKWLLDVAAIGTVADCMPLIGENRAIVKYGLIVLSKTRREGLRQMFAVGRLSIDEDHIPDARTIGFQIGPRINAASRMAHAQTAHELLMETKPERARDLALELESNNVARQKVSDATTSHIRKIAETLYKDRKLIFAAGEHYPLGVAGLVAGRIAHEFGKPTAVFHKGETESVGSFRSIPALSIIEAIEECSDLLEKFGGHSQAAGATVRNDRLELFYEKLESVINERLKNISVEPILDIDVEVSSEYMTPALLSSVKRFAPFGEGNREPVFLVRNVSVCSSKLVGNGSKHLKLGLLAGSKAFDAIGFGLGEAWEHLAEGDWIDVVFTLDENTWNGVTKLQWKLLDIQFAKE